MSFIGREKWGPACCHSPLAVLVFSLAVFILFSLACKRKPPDEILAVKNLITRWQNGLILNNLDSLAVLFSPKRDWVIKDAPEMSKLFLSSNIFSVRVTRKSIQLYKEEEKVQSAGADLYLTGAKMETSGQVEWKGKLRLLLRKYKNEWGIVDYKLE